MLLLAMLVTAADVPARGAGFSLKQEFHPVKRFVGPTLYLKRAAQPPVLDGDLGDAIWEAAAQIPALVFLPSRSTYNTLTEQTRVWVSSDDRNIYVAAECREHRIDEMYDTAGAEAAYNWVALMFDPEYGRRDFYQLRANVLGPVGVANSRVGRVWEPRWRTAAKKHTDRWTIEMAVPFAELNARPPRPGQPWGFDFLRQRVLWKDPANPKDNAWYKRGLQRSLWSPSPGGFGTPQFFGTIVFGTPEQHRRFVTPPTLTLHMDRKRYTRLDGRAHLVLQVSPGSYKLSDLSAAVACIPAGKTAPAHTLSIPTFRGEIYEALLDVTGLSGEYEVVAELRDRRERRDDRAEPAAAVELGYDRFRGAGSVFSIGARVKVAPAAAARQAAPLQRATWSFRKEAGNWRAAEAKLTRVPLRIPPTAATRETVFPITTGVPLPKGALFDPARARVVDAAGNEVASQKIVRSRWHEPDGSIRWLGLDFDALLAPGQESGYALEFGTDARPRTNDERPTNDKGEAADSPQPGANGQRSGRSSLVVRRSSLVVEERPDHIVVDTGALRFEVAKKGFAGIGRAWLDADGDGRFTEAEAVPAPADARGSYVVDQAGTLYTSVLDPAPRVVVEERGPRRVCLAAKGWHVAKDGRKLCQYVLRIYAYAGKPYTRVFHTVVNTADSTRTFYADWGLDMPFAAGESYRFGAARLEQRRTVALYPDFAQVAGGKEFVAEPLLGQDDVLGGALAPGERVSLLQRTPDDFLLRRWDARGNVAGRTDGAKSAGWFRADRGALGLTAMVRDLWQSYPKELEIAGDRMTFHAWPAHGEPGPAPDPANPIAEAHRMWFCHSGKLLDFRVPDAFFEMSPIVAFADQPVELLRQKEPFWNFLSAWAQSIGASRDANAIGVAKTHELLLLFHPSDLPDAEVSSLTALNQQWPHALPDPRWVCDSGVIGPQWPVDRERFPRVEEAVERNFKGLVRIHRLLDTYGMWNYGDSFTSIDIARGREGAKLQPNIYRMFNNTHYFLQDNNWLQYMRSGDPFYLEVARAATSHASDVDCCHYVDPKVDETKRVGGFSHCKYYVHWRNHNECTGHNVAVEFLLWSYFLEGNRRALDVLGEWREGAKEVHVPTDGGRESINDIYSMVADYTSFRDPAFLPKIWATYEIQNFREAWGRFWAPYLLAVHEMTGDPEALAQLTDRLEESIAKNEEDTLALRLTDLGYAYLQTRDRKYLEYGMPILTAVAEKMLAPGRELREEGKLSYLDGVFSGQWYVSSWYPRRYGVFLRALAEAGITVDWEAKPRQEAKP